jgi:hypothetical protein
MVNDSTSYLFNVQLQICHASSGRKQVNQCSKLSRKDGGVDNWGNGIWNSTQCCIGVNNLAFCTRRLLISRINKIGLWRARSVVLSKHVTPYGPLTGFQQECKRIPPIRNPLTHWEALTSIWRPNIIKFLNSV